MPDIRLITSYVERCDRSPYGVKAKTVIQDLNINLEVKADGRLSKRSTTTLLAHLEDLINNPKYEALVLNPDLNL